MNYFVSLGEDFISLLFPRICHACGQHLVRNENIICTGCRVALPLTGTESVRKNFVEKLFWGRCLLERAASYAYYTRGGRMSRLIYRFKYDGIREIGVELGKIYGILLLESGFLDGIDCLIPVPLHRRKERIRGFNQSAVIAGAISSVTGIPVMEGRLVRSAITGSQTTRSRIERWRNVDGIFCVRAGEEMKGLHVLIVDDVITTGSTIDSCATALSSFEGIRVSAVSLAVAAM